MTISALSASLAGLNNTSDARGTLSSNKATFLQLLTTQLKNQDPLAPTDTNTFTQQLVQYSQVEQQITTNEKLDTIAKLNVSNKIQNALSLVGGEVQYGGKSFDYTSGSVSKVDYTLPSNVSTNTISIIDKNGNTVYTTTGALVKGNSTFSWDGTTDQGTVAPSGTYTISIGAKDATGQSVSATTSVWGQVNSIQATDKEILLMLKGGGSVPLDDVSNIRASETPTNT